MMKWRTLSVEAEMGIKEGMPCSVCGKVVHDLMFFPADTYEGEAKRLVDAWRSDPAKESSREPDQFFVCEDCRAKF